MMIISGLFWNIHLYKYSANVGHEPKLKITCKLNVFLKRTTDVEEEKTLLTEELTL